MQRDFIMKKIIGLFCLGCVIGEIGVAYGAANVLVPKKADSVVKRDTSASTTDVGASLLQTAGGLVVNAIAMGQEQKKLVAGCEPTSSEVSFVNSMIKEWAIAGAKNPLASKDGVGGTMKGCTDANGVSLVDGEDKPSYAATVKAYYASAGNDIAGLICYDVFKNDEARGAVWAGFPKAAVADYCAGGGDLSLCSKGNKKKATNLWTLFELIDFEEKDYTRAEASKALALLQKAQNCSGTKLAAKRLESFGGFLVNTVGNLGQKTNTASIMDAIPNLVGPGGGAGKLGGIAPVVTQFLDR